MEIKDLESNLVNGEVKTYVFNVEKPPQMDNVKNTFWKIFPSLLVSLPCLSFGLMLGWPSPTFPNLLQESAPIKITWDQTALIAGFLMIGNLFGTTFSWVKPFGLKYGILVSTFPIIIGWLIIWKSFDVIYILIGRFLIGFGNGYVTPHISEYINDSTENVIRLVLLKFTYFFIMLGVCLTYCVGPFLDFRIFSLSAFILSVIISIILMFIPYSPSELFNLNKPEKGEKRLSCLRPNTDVESFKNNLENQSNELGLIDMVKNKYYLKTIPILLILVIFQQFTGPPPVLVYSNIIFDKFGCHNPELYAIVYIFFYMISIIFTSFYSHKIHVKYSLLSTCFISTILMSANAYLNHFYPQPSWAYVKSLILVIYIFIHTFGMGFIPSIMAPKFFELNSIKSINRIQVGLHCICAIVSTKLFQVIITYHAFYLGFVYLAAIAGFGTIFILMFVPSEFKK
nr:sugar transporter ERD6-like 9 [Onthophagus taurus]XP_022917108.1 sugar transporter ERD6-like 9 [Onthophagus taurus]